MKTNMLVSAVFVFAFISIASAPSPETTSNSVSVKTTDSFSFIRCHRQGKGAAITWGFNSANVVSFAVQRTDQDPTDQYSVWECICNTTANSSRSYKYHDATAFVGINSYRVVALMNDGNTITSAIDQVRIVGH
jgi:FlaG/FlaF family flagellin (archaellin)